MWQMFLELFLSSCHIVKVVCKEPGFCFVSHTLLWLWHNILLQFLPTFCSWWLNEVNKCDRMNGCVHKSGANDESNTQVNFLHYSSMSWYFFLFINSIEEGTLVNDETEKIRREPLCTWLRFPARALRWSELQNPSERDIACGRTRRNKTQMFKVAHKIAHIWKYFLSSFFSQICQNSKQPGVKPWIYSLS